MKELTPKQLEKRKKTNKTILIVFGSLIAIIILFVTFAIEPADEVPVDPKTEMIQSQFSQWDGSHNNLKKLIKEGMNDPKSFEHVETNYWTVDDHLVVQTKYRGKNGFGALMLGSVKAKVDSFGNVLEIIEQQ